MSSSFSVQRHESTDFKLKVLLLIVIGAILVSTCQTVPIVVEAPSLDTIEQIPAWMTEAEARTLASLEQVDKYPLYTMVYQADYADKKESAFILDGSSRDPAWACSLFAVFGDPDNILFGRNFDWDFSPGLLLFTDPPEGYASVSMVDLYYLGFGDDRAFGIKDLPLEDRIDLLDAPYIPFDGMNEAGLAVGMAAVPGGGMEPDPEKETIDSVMVIRKILDQAATIEEAVDIVESHNIDMLGQNLHYLIAEKTGRSALIEISGGEVVVILNTQSWQPATNFLVSEVRTDPEAYCWRYGLITQRLTEKDGKLTAREAMGLLEDVAQQSTQWSVVYRISAGEIRIAMGRNYDEEYKFKIE
jgi:hypothetical protein